MTFDEWWDDVASLKFGTMEMLCKNMAHAAYEAGQRAEREACAEIATACWPCTEWLNDSTYREREAMQLISGAIADQIRKRDL